MYFIAYFDFIQNKLKEVLHWKISKFLCMTHSDLIYERQNNLKLNVDWKI